MIFQDIGELNHQFPHARDGEVILALTTPVPSHWGGTDPERLRPLAEEVGLGDWPFTRIAVQVSRCPS